MKVLCTKVVRMFGRIKKSVNTHTASRANLQINPFIVKNHSNSFLYNLLQLLQKLSKTGSFGKVERTGFFAFNLKYDTVYEKIS